MIKVRDILIAAVLAAAINFGVVLVIVNYESSENLALDGFAFEEEQFVINDPVITVVTYPSRTSLLRAYDEITLGDGDQVRKVNDNTDLQAFSKVNELTGRCEVHTLDPRVSYSPELMGHELTHCLYGEWHPEQTKALLAPSQ